MLLRLSAQILAGSNPSSPPSRTYPRRDINTQELSARTEGPGTSVKYRAFPQFLRSASHAVPAARVRL